MGQYQFISSRATGSITNHKVLRNTYLLLSMTLLFSGSMAAMSYYFQLPHPGLLLTLAGAYGLLFLVRSLQNQASGILATFAFTGFMGYTLGPVLSMYVNVFTNGPQIICMSLSLTGIIFLALSAYVLTSGKDFSFMKGFVFTGTIAAIALSFITLFFSLPLMSIILSGFITVLMSAAIMIHTSDIINGGETNYISATVSLFVAMYNLFLNLIHLLSAFAGNRD